MIVSFLSLNPGGLPKQQLGFLELLRADAFDGPGQNSRQLHAYIVHLVFNASSHSANFVMLLVCPKYSSANKLVLYLVLRFTNGSCARLAITVMSLLSTSYHSRAICQLVFVDLRAAKPEPRVGT